MSEVHVDLSVAVGPGDAGQRLDRVLAAGLPQFSRSRLQALIRAGAVRIDGVVATDGARKVRGGEVLTMLVPEPVAAEPEGQPIPLSIVFEDSHLLVIDKPAGLVVHPGSGNADGTLVNALIAHCGDSLSGIGGVKRPGIVHRLDKDTSGLLVVAKTDAAHAGLSGQFAAHGLDGRLQREYIAVVWGAFDQPKGTIDLPLGRSVNHRTKMAVVREAFGRKAVTHHATEAVCAGGLVSLMRLQLETGRTHQIRVHMAHAGHPLLGDLVYGAGFATRRSKLPEAAAAVLDALGRQALHAATLGFEHPITKKILHFESEPPADLARLIIAVRQS